MRKQFLIVAFISLLQSVIYGQILTVEQEVIYDLDSVEIASTDLVALSSGDFVFGYIHKNEITSGATSNYLYNVDILIIQPNGNIVAEYTYGGSQSDYAGEIVVDEDDNIIIFGGSNSNNNGFQRGLFCMKITPSGEVLWQTNLPDYPWQYANDIQRLQNGNYLLLTSFRVPNFAFQPVLIEIDPVGQVVREKIIGEYEGYNYGRAVQELPDSKILLTSITNEDGRSINEDEDIIIIKLDSDWNIEWEFVTGGNDADDITDIASLSSGNAILTGWTRSNDGDYASINGSTDALAYCLDTRTGEIFETIIFGGTSGDRILKILQHPEYGTLLVGGSGDLGSLLCEEQEGNIFIIHVDEHCNFSWITGEEICSTNSNVSILDNGKIAVVSTVYQPTGFIDLCYSLLSIDNNTFNNCTLDGDIRVEVEKDLPLGFTPNNDGVNDLFVVSELENNPEQYDDNELTIFNRWGQVVYYAEPYQNNWNGTHYQTGELLPAGAYFYSLQLRIEEGETRKGVVVIMR